MDRLASFVYDRARLIIIITVVLTVIALASVYRFELDTDFMSFISDGNPKSEVYNALNAKYQNGEPISILIEHDDSLLDRESLLEVYRLQEEVRAIGGVLTVQSFLPSEVFVDGQPIPVDDRLIAQDHEMVAGFIEHEYYLTDQSLSSDRSKGIMTAIPASNAAIGGLVEALRSIVGEEDAFDLSLAGNEVMKDTLKRSMVTVLLYLPPLAVLLILIVFLAFIRNLKLTILAMTPAALAVLWSYGTILWSGREVDLVLSIAPLFVLVLGTAYGFHYVSHFNDVLRDRDLDSRQLTTETMRMVGTPLILATVTTMAGFASLTWTEVLPFRYLGIFATIGVAYAGLLSLFFLPALLSRVKLPTNTSEVRRSRLPGAILALSRQRALVAILFVAIVGTSAFYIPRIEIVSDQLLWFKENSETRRVYNTIEEHFGGASPLIGEIASEQGLAGLMDSQFANEVLATERELEGLPGIRSVFSIFDLTKAVNRMTTGQDAYPEDPSVLQAVLAPTGSTDMTAWIQNWVAADGFRMMIRTEELGSEDIVRLERFVEDNDHTIRVITGMPMLFGEMNTLVTQSQIRSLALAFGLILLVLLVTYRRLTPALLCLLPIMITVIGILGFLAMSGMHLQIVTAMLSAICIGVGVDYGIHMISAIHSFRDRGQDRRRAVTSAISVVSAPVLANALGITLGLSTLFFAPLKAYTDAAAVISLAMVLSAMGALLLIPVLYSMRVREPTTPQCGDDPSVFAADGGDSAVEDEKELVPSG